MIERISGRRTVWCAVMKGLCIISLAIVTALTAFMLIYVLARGIRHITPELLFTSPSMLRNTIGILPDILNTLYIVIATLVVVLPIGVGAAIYLNEYATNRKVVEIIEFAAETLSGIPSIIYGLVGMLVFVQFCSLGTSLLAGALTLVIMNLPTIMRTTQESLKTVPESYREGVRAWSRQMEGHQDGCPADLHKRNRNWVHPLHRKDPQRIGGAPVHGRIRP